MSNSNAPLIASALKQTDPDLYSKIDGGTSWLEAITKRGARVALYRKYDDGDSRSSLTDKMREMLRLVRDEADLNDLTDNYCEIVIDKMAGRVSVSEISTNDDTADKSWLEPMLDVQDFQAAEGMWWRGAIRDGDAFVMVDPQTLLWSNEPAFDGFAGVVAIYNQMTRKPVWACKVWSESDTEDRGDDDEASIQIVMHLVVYQSDRVTYWTGNQGTYEIIPSAQGDNGANEKPWPVELKGMLPFVSYANQRDNYTRYGKSEIRKAIPLQDVLNRTLYSMVMASEFAAFPVNYSIGMNIDPSGVVPGGIINLALLDANGAQITDFTPEQVAFLSSCKVGQLGVVNIAQYTQQIETVVREISQATQTPIYGITTQGAISGDALKQLEVGLIGKVMRFQRQNADALKELITLTNLMSQGIQARLERAGDQDGTGYVEICGTT